MAMTTIDRPLPRDELLTRYLEALRRHEIPDDDIRTCVHCGTTGTFHTDPEGGWARCDACGEEA